VTASVQLKKTITGRDSQGAFRQDELIGGKPPVVKYLTVTELSGLRVAVVISEKLVAVAGNSSGT
jgi:hypothetical protein